ncbi:O-linked N-acetylglucosamine transferase, SPINDLY family protein [Methylococcus geothermalis]|uniref:UDP-N-acetylglucosamine-peptide N-acetylglucosaminyltransferase n=1 Tax=Methylococcus geothermalis TaxID=2681310 RepID=A0A858Q698_9GAMM|nr:UDP-N-acetylglucosamine-peptide N-acetylglucosaminyltransferase [Methylococcus geothermalis]QJD29347.1 UDP-N-acetylglucosamine-peptide N-acetylglucosaminyltransferase [Methylococcus geothermalis]
MNMHALSQLVCDWSYQDTWVQAMRDLLARGVSGKLAPFSLLSFPEMSAGEQRQCSELWLRDRIAASEEQRQARNFEFTPSGRMKLRIGYLSSDFHEHATAFLLVEMLELHDRARFEIFAYSYGPDDGKGMRQRLERTFDRFTDIEALTNEDAASLIHRDGIDILVDLKGYTRASRTMILTFRPAPIQVNYLGYPGTLGGDFADYIVTDPVLTPQESAEHYSEAFAYLPDSYQPHGCRGAVGEKPSRKDAGLPERGFVFCCFNQAYKITPVVFDIWCRLLAAVPGSVLWLLKNPSAEANLEREALRRGIAPARLVFADEKPQIEHLGRLQLADLMVDTWPYNAHTSASDALWAGVPIVTCMGETFPSRVAGSLLSAIGLPELITTELGDYHDLALELATQPERLARVNARLMANRLTTPLFDTPRYTRNLEALYQAMWQRYADGLAPGIIRLD